MLIIVSYNRGDINEPNIQFANRPSRDEEIATFIDRLLSVKDKDRILVYDVGSNSASVLYDSDVGLTVPKGATDL